MRFLETDHTHLFCSERLVFIVAIKQSSDSISRAKIVMRNNAYLTNSNMTSLFNAQ